VRWWDCGREKQQSKMVRQARQRGMRSPALLVSTGTYHSALVTEDGCCWVWGRYDRIALARHDCASHRAHLPAAR